MTEPILEETSANLKVRPLCKPDMHLKKSRQRIFNENSIELVYSFGYQSSFGPNLCMLKENIVIVVAGNYLNLLNIDTASETFVPSIHGSGFTCASVHPSTYFFAGAEKGQKFCINVFKYPALEVCKTLKEESAIMPTQMMQFHPQGDLLVALSFDPENKIFIWQWDSETVVFISEDSPELIYSMHFLTEDQDTFITSGEGHVTFWNLNVIKDDRDVLSEICVTFCKEIFQESPKHNIYCTVSVSDTFLSATVDGFLLLWDAKSPSFDNVMKISMHGEKPCHDGCIYHIIIHKNYIVTFGSDGFIKFWDYDTIFNAEICEGSTPEENVTVSEKNDSEETVTKNIYLNPVKSYLISQTSDLVYGIICVVKYDYTTYIIQDMNGVLFHVVISSDLSDMTITRLLSGLGQNIVGLTYCPSYPYIAASSNLGTVIIYDCVAKDVFKYSTFPVPVTSIIWPSSETDVFASSLIVGFLDGTLRWIAFAENSEHFILKFVIKPHINAIEHLKINDSCTILISQGLDSKLFFYSIEKFSLIPLGFYINHHEVIDFTWLKYTSSAEQKETLLILCKYSYVIETEIPDPKTFTDMIELRKTYYIENKQCQVYKINGLREYHELGDRIYDSDCEEQPDLNVAEKEVLKMLKYQEKKERRESRRFELGISGTVMPPEIFSYLPSSTSNHIWLSLGKEDFGYIFEFKFSGVFTSEPTELVPIRALEILTAEIIPVLTMQYSPCGKCIFMGLQDGSLNVCFLEHSFMPESGYDFAKYQLHDPDEGAVQHVKISREGSFIVTAGCDGNILVFSFNMFDYKDVGDYEIKPVLIDLTEVDNISVKSLSIEDQLQYEMNAKYHQMKEQIKSGLENLKEEYLALKVEQLTAYIDLCNSSLKKLRNIPEELKLNPEMFSASTIAIEIFLKNTDKLLENIDAEFERDIAKSKLLHEKYFNFYKSRIDHGKLQLKSNVEKIFLSTFRNCKFPSNICDVQLGTYPSMFRHKEKVFEEGRKKNAKVSDEKIKLLHELSGASKAIIDYPNDTPVSELISRYNQRKEEHIKMLKEHIAEYDIMENIVIDDKRIKDTIQEIEASQFKFKEANTLEKHTSQYISQFSTYREKKERIALYYQKVCNFVNFFNDLVYTVLKCQTNLLEKNVGDSAVNTMITEEVLLDQNMHIYFKRGRKSEVCKSLLKIEWIHASEDNELFIDDKNNKEKILLEIDTEKLIKLQKTCNNFFSILMMAKPKVNCEKKFYDIRFLLKCIELNIFKKDLMQEKKWLKIVKELEVMLHAENKELAALEEKMSVLKSKRQLEKKEWMNIYSQFRKAIGLRHKHKGYFKHVFKKKIRPDDEKEPYRRHPSSESSESEQNINSEDDFPNINPKNVDKDLLKEVMLFRLKRHEVEKRMKEYKRNLQGLTAKQVAFKRRILRINDALTDAWKELSSIPVRRKEEQKHVIWPVVLFPENVHKDFLNKQMTSVYEQKMSARVEMSLIHETIIKELKPIYKLIRVALIIVTDRVINEELNDLIDIGYVFFSLVDTVAQEVDEYFAKLAFTESIIDKKQTIDVGKKHVNIIQEILSAATKEPADSEIKSEKENDSNIDSSSMTEMEALEESEKHISQHTEPFKITSHVHKSKYADHLSLTQKSVLKSWRDINDDFESTSKERTINKFDLKNIILRAVPTLDKSLLVDDVFPSKEDYYMQPLCFKKSLEFHRRIADKTELTDSDFTNMLLELDATEVIEDLITSVIEKEQCSENANKFIGDSYPVYPGGGFVFRRDVLLSMEDEDPDSFPYGDFYQEPLFIEEVLEKPKLTHIVPTHKETQLQYSLSQISDDFIVLNMNDVLATLKAYDEIKVTNLECENQIRLLEKKVLKARNIRINVEQELLAVARERTEAMRNKFNRVVNLDILQDIIENPHLHIKKYESDKKLESLKKSLKKLKISEVTALKILDECDTEDTIVCHELLELRHEFRMLNKKYSSQLLDFPKSGKDT